MSVRVGRSSAIGPALLVSGAATLGWGCTQAAELPGIALELPVACEVGRTCFIQQYFDHDPGPGARDWRGGPKAYDRHDGADFRLPSTAVQRAGVQVRAAAPGVVKAIRDGEPDRSGGAGSAATVTDRECGNGVVLTHPAGWETQYCHMAQGSIAVRAGQAVAAGAPLGRVGQSGRAEFPHLHLTVRRDGAAVDPFGLGLWSRRAAAALPYRAPEVINAGFAGGPVTGEQIETETVPPPAAGGAALVAYVRAIALQQGDVQTLMLLAPDGRLLSENRTPALDRAKAQYFLFTGKRNTAGRWPAGTWKARYTVTRSGRVVLDHTFSLRL